MTSPNTEKGSTQKEPAAPKLQLALTKQPSLPGNRPIVPTNKDPDIDDFVGYMD